MQIGFFLKMLQKKRSENAIDQEIDSIQRNKTLELMELLSGKKAIDVKWVYKSKLNSQGEVDKYKACLMVKSYKQKIGINYQDVFALVARLEIIKIVLVLTGQKDEKFIKWMSNQNS